MSTQTTPFITSGLVALAVVLSYAVLKAVRGRSTLKDIRGPESKSFWLGNEQDIRYQNEVGDHEFKWMREYGSVWRTTGCLGEDILMVADPKALQYILHTSGYKWPKSTVATEEIRFNPSSYLAPQLESFLSLFQNHSMKLVQNWKDEIAGSSSPSEGTLINVATWLTRTTLDIIGLAGFSYEFNALENGDSELAKMYHNLFLDSSLYPNKIDYVFRSFWHYIPEPLLHLVRFLPIRQYARSHEYINFMRTFAPRIIRQNESLGDGKDILSVLARANAAGDPKARLSDVEVQNQMSTVLLAGHDTTANTLLWFFYEIAKHPEWQTKVREEIAAVRVQVNARGDEDFSIADLEGMTMMHAALKESMRLHPIVWQLVRVAGQNDVLPLAFPIRTKSGENISQIPVQKGQTVYISIAAYNRLEGIWGADAHEFHPERFLEMDKAKQTSIGVYANLLNFSGGIRACIGWRFSVIELQAIVSTLLENFEFSMPEGDKQKTIMRKPSGIMLPLVEGYHGSWMGLQVCPVQ
ncbi:hypothetical protein EWM64_g229 [Hericium alpestre]|uniref:Cytochrome P450 n=1 Tax=Hericium alpestre TaxID=135208 RepID=A0A4Z0ABP9_9AGAM|nr:hypothetical protein EWM64_g229 [Hericium alpestre]